MVSEKLKDWWKQQEDVDKIRVVKEKASLLDSLHKKMVKAVKAENDFGLNRTGVRGGRFTSLYAKATNSSKMYYDCLEEIKYMVSTLC